MKTDLKLHLLLLTLLSLHPDAGILCTRRFRRWQMEPMLYEQRVTPLQRHA